MLRVIQITVALIFFVNCTSTEARHPITQKSTTFTKEAIKTNKQLNKLERSAFKALFAKYPNTTFIASQHGFWYTYNLKSNSDSIPKPKFGNLVNFDFNIKNITEDIIYSKAENKTQNYVIDQQDLFMGLREGLKLMKVGETVTFYFPSGIAYGYYGDGNKIKSNTPIISEVTLNSIN